MHRETADDGLPWVDEFADYIAPVSLDEFFGNYWGKRPLRVEGKRDRYAALFNRAVFDALLPAAKTITAGFRDEIGWYTDLEVTANQVKRLAEARMTICAGVLPPHPPLAAFIESYRRAVSFAGTVHFNAYMSPDGSGFSLHLDDHPVVVLQIEGAKHWWVSPEVAVENPPRSFSFPPNRDVLRAPWGTYERPDESRFIELTMEPGDLLYIPAGCWHHTRAVGSSLALTMASIGVTPLELAQGALLEQLQRHPRIVHRLWGGDARTVDAETLPDAMRPVFEDAAASIRDIVGAIDGKSLYRLWSAMKK